MNAEQTPECGAALAGREQFTALVIDDEPHARAFLRLILRSLGVVKVHEAGHGAAGVELYRSIQPTFVLLDVNMPVMTGETALRAILAIDPDAAVIVVTSQSEHETVKRFLEFGAAGYVLKHRPAAEVCRMLAEVLESFVVAAED